MRKWFSLVGLSVIAAVVMIAGSGLVLQAATPTQEPRRGNAQPRAQQR